MSLGGLNHIELLKIRKTAGVIIDPDIILLLEYIKGLESDNEKLREQVNDKQESGGRIEEDIREPEPRRTTTKRVRKRTKVRRTSSTTEDN